MKKYLPIMILICLLFSIHCSDRSVDIEETVIKSNDELANVEFVKEKSILITGMSYNRLMVDIHSGDVFVYGYETEKEDKLVLKRHDNELNFISRKDFFFGQGPNDVGTGTTFCQAGDVFYGPDNSLMRINVFDKDFNFVKYVKVLSPYLSTTFTEDGKYFLGIDMTRVSKGYKYDLMRCSFPGLDKKIIHPAGTFWLWNEQKKTVIGINPLISFFLKGEKVYFLNSADYRIIMFDLNGNPLKKVRLDIPKKKVPKDKKKEWLFDQMGNYGLKRNDLAEYIQPASLAVPLGKGFVVIRRDDYSTACKGMIECDYFDFELNLIGKTIIPCFYLVKHITTIRNPNSYQYHAGNLYLISEDEENEDFYLEKWKVVENR